MATIHLYDILLAIVYIVQQVLARDDSIALPRGHGVYRTSLAHLELIDTSRPDPFNSTHVRRIMISRFDPIPASKCTKFGAIPYMPPATAAIEDEILAEYDYPKGLWARFVHQVCKPQEGDERGKKREYPLALFSPGLNTTRLFTNHLAQEVASHGYTVINMDHPYDTDVVEFSNGDVIIGGRVTKENASLEHALDVRAADASFVLDHLGVHPAEQKAVIFGQSFGGAASATAMLKDKRFRAGVNLDGLMFGPVLATPLGTATRSQAFMLWGSDMADEYPSWVEFWDTLSNSSYVDYKKEFGITNTTHGSYWDLNVLVDVAGIRNELSETAQLLIGPVPGDRVWAILGRYLSAFFRYTLDLGMEEAILKRPSKQFPEVKVVHS